MTMTDASNPLDDLFGDSDSANASAATDSAAADTVLHSTLDLDCLDIGDLETELEADRNAPLEIIHNPITGNAISSANVQQVVASYLSLTMIKSALDVFENELRKAALNLAEGTTKTRRLTAEIDGELRTVIVYLPDETWSEQELGAIAAWVNRKEMPEAAKKLYARCVREKVKTERSPIKKETKKLESERFPEGSDLEDLRSRILKANKGTVGKLPRLKVEGDKLNEWEQRRFGDGDDAE